jgi:hypothetical protein
MRSRVPCSKTFDGITPTAPAYTTSSLVLAPLA